MPSSEIRSKIQLWPHRSGCVKGCDIDWILDGLQNGPLRKAGPYNGKVKNKVKSKVKNNGKYKGDGGRGNGTAEGTTEDAGEFWKFFGAGDESGGDCFVGVGGDCVDRDSGGQAIFGGDSGIGIDCRVGVAVETQSAG